MDSSKNNMFAIQFTKLGDSDEKLGTVRIRT